MAKLRPVSNADHNADCRPTFPRFGDQSDGAVGGGVCICHGLSEQLGKRARRLSVSSSLQLDVAQTTAIHPTGIYTASAFSPVDLMLHRRPRNSTTSRRNTRARIATHLGAWKRGNLGSTYGYLKHPCTTTTKELVETGHARLREPWSAWALHALDHAVACSFAFLCLRIPSTPSCQPNLRLSTVSEAPGL
jgi:hypothetical protein